MRLADIGVNLTHRSFDRDRAEVVARAEAAGVSPLVITGTSVGASREAADYAGSFPALPGGARRIYATAGVHPHDAKSCGSGTLAALRELAGRETVIAVGECGLDYDRDFSPRPVQRLWFEKQIGLAAELGMPLFLHERGAFGDFAAMLKQHAAGIGNFVVHCFTGSRRELESYLSLGAYIGITGWFCDERRGARLWDLAGEIPAGRLLVETDAPFLLPRDLPRGPGAGGGRSGRNEPRHLPHILRAIAAKAGKDAEQLAAETFAATQKFFGI
ncbi:MAG: TatD family hydrolase [Treponema sp.]|jgi:TatD DNase family protein|nr:TatD family hydrolase [Treponema sp.]